MLIAVQFPLTDLRRFVAEPTGQLEIPPWPLARPNHHFVRGFGPVVRRRRGGVDAWVGEELFCRANRALCFPSRFRPGPPTGDLQRLAVQCAFRRLICAGGPAARVEIGLSIRPVGKQAIPPTHLTALLQWITSLPVVVPTTQLPYAGPLLRAGRPLAQHLLASTTRRSAPTPRGWLTAGEPLIYVEYGPDELTALPSGIQPIPRWADEHRIDLAHARMNAHAIGFRTWFSRAGPHSDRDVVRRLRIHLLRLHAERECLSQALRSIATGAVPVPSDRDAAERLQRYLHDATRMLNRRTLYGLPQSELLMAAHTYQDLIEPGLRGTLFSQLEHVRRNVRTKLREATTPPANATQDVIYFLQAGDLTMNQFTIKFGNNNVIHGDMVVAQRIQDSFNRAAASEADVALKNELQALSQAVAEMTTRLDTQPARQASRDLDTLTAEALSSPPRQQWLALSADGLIQAAARVGDAANLVVKLVRSVLSLIGS